MKCPVVALRILLPRAASRCVISLLGGEPFLHPSFPAVVDLIRAECDSESRDAAVNVSTNGTIFSVPLAKCLLNNRVKTSISIDGPASIQDVQRPNARGGGSFSTVYTNLRRFWDELGPDLAAVRITCTPESISVIPDFLATLRECFPGIRTELGGSGDGGGDAERSFQCRIGPVVRGRLVRAHGGRNHNQAGSYDLCPQTNADDVALPVN